MTCTAGGEKYVAVAAGANVLAFCITVTAAPVVGSLSAADDHIYGSHDTSKWIASEWVHTGVGRTS